MFRRLRSSWWQRPLAALFAVWFVVATTEIVSLHACPMHDGPVSTTGMTMPGMSGHAMHAGDMAQHAGDTSTPDSSQHSCTCLGHCCAAVTSLHVRTQVALFAAALSDTAQVAQFSVVVPRTSWIDFVLPFATAPPMIAIA